MLHIRMVFWDDLLVDYIFVSPAKVVVSDAGCIGLFDGVMVVYGMIILLTI